MIKKILAVSIILMSSKALAHTGPTLEHFKRPVEKLFNKPVFTSLNSEDFPYHELSLSDLNNQKNKLAKKNFISNFLKVRDLSLIETDTGVLIVKTRDSIKFPHPVFKDKLPKKIREQMVTVIKELPENKAELRVDKALRSFYSRDGDIHVSSDKSTLIITDWKSNVNRMLNILHKL